MNFTFLDWSIVVVFLAIVILIGWIASWTAGKDTSEYFLGGRSLSWWLLGISMVACTFSADTPNLVTGMVRENGVAKNWAWWAFLITGMVTVFIYSKLWRRSNLLTDLEFYEIRYSGKMASFLRGFRALYLGVFFNSLIMGTVTLAAIKISGVMFGLSPFMTVFLASIAIVVYVGLGGIKGVVWADFFQYSIAMFGAIYAAVVAVRQPEIGSLKNLLTHPNVVDKLSFVPDLNNPSVYISLLIIPVAVQWWAVWYPGAEPGGGGYIAQKMLAAKNEKNAIGATLLFNFAHYAIRPWPWIIVALASLVIYPNLESISQEFPNIDPQYLGHDIAYPVMLTKLSPGWLGVVVASIIAAYMSTIGTHLNWGSSYVVNDFYSRFVKPDASQKELVMVGRISTIVLMFLAGFLALTFLENATQAFNVLLLSGAGSGAIFLLRWFWWRINAITEIIAMVVATVTAVILVLFIEDADVRTVYLDGFTVKLLIAVGITTISWLSTTLLTRPESYETLKRFYLITHPGGPGWRKIFNMAQEKKDKELLDADQGWDVPQGLLSVLLGCLGIYSALFGIGNIVYGNVPLGLFLFVIMAVCTFLIMRISRKFKY